MRALQTKELKAIAGADGAGAVAAVGIGAGAGVTVASSIVEGAEIGAPLGPVGVAAGAIIGGAVGFAIYELT